MAVGCVMCESLADGKHRVHASVHPRATRHRRFNLCLARCCFSGWGGIVLNGAECIIGIGNPTSRHPQQKLTLLGKVGEAVGDSSELSRSCV